MKKYWKVEFSEAIIYPFLFIIVAYILTEYTDWGLFEDSSLDIYLGVALVGMLVTLTINLFWYIRMKQRKRH